MGTAAFMLVLISVVAVSDVLIALYFRSLADRVEIGETVSSSVDPAGARKMAAIMLVGAPLMWLIIALISFGVVPSGIDPIKF